MTAEELVMKSAEMPYPVLTAGEVTSLRQGAFERLKALGILRLGTLAQAVGCNACELDHVEDVEAVVEADGFVRFFIACPEKGRVEVPVARLQRWVVDFTPLARAIQEGLGASGALEEVASGRLWKLGTAILAGQSHALWMAREPFATRGQDMSSLIPEAGYPVVFLLGARPPSHLARGCAAVIDIRDVIVPGNLDLRVDRRLVESRLAGWMPAGVAGAHRKEQSPWCRQGLLVAP